MNLIIIVIVEIQTNKRKNALSISMSSPSLPVSQSQVWITVLVIVNEMWRIWIWILELKLKLKLKLRIAIYRAQERYRLCRCLDSHDSAKVSLSFSLQPTLFFTSSLPLSPTSPSFPPGKYCSYFPFKSFPMYFNGISISFLHLYLFHKLCSISKCY